MTDVTSGVPARTRTATRSVEPGTSSALPYVLFAILAGTAVITLIPVVWMILTALKTPAEVAADPPTWIPETLPVRRTSATRGTSPRSAATCSTRS